MTRRNFSPAIRKAAYERDGGKCCRCGVSAPLEQTNCDHVVPDALGGANTLENAETLCIPCHRTVKTPADAARLAKAKRMKLKHETGKSHQHATRPIRSRGFAGWKRFNGEVVKADA